MLKPMVDLPFQPILWGGEPHDFTKQNGDHNLQLNVYTNETIQRYICGTRCMTWDGRVYRYVHCGASPIPNNKYGVKNFTILVACKAAGGNRNAVTVVDTAVGETAVKVTFDPATLGNSQSVRDTEGPGLNNRTGVLYEHELCGGFISFYTGNYRQQRGLVGNTAVIATGTSMIIYLDAPLDHELNGSVCEILSNPYMCIGESNDQFASVMGVAMVTAVVGDYIWIQTWGILRFTYTGSDYGDTINERQFVFVSDGAIIPDMGGTARQHAGFLIERTSGEDLSAATFIMLQISP